LKGGNAHLERLTGFDGEQKESLFRRRAQMEESESEEDEAARVAMARNSLGKRERTPNKSSKTTPTHSPQKKETSPARSLARAPARPPAKLARGKLSK
jgi:hypothetical protein